MYFRNTAQSQLWLHTPTNLHLDSIKISYMILNTNTINSSSNTTNSCTNSKKLVLLRTHGPPEVDLFQTLIDKTALFVVNQFCSHLCGYNREIKMSTDSMT